MLSREKIALINECVRVSRNITGTIYGFIDIFGDTFVFGENELQYLPKDIGVLYCKAKDGTLVL